MEQFVADFPDQIRKALSSELSLKPSCAPVRYVLCAGMGGSGIGSQLAVSLLGDNLQVPVISVKDYHLPAWLQEGGLLILSSYSGQTEEVLSLLDQAQNRSCQIACISSGGELAEIAERKGYNLIRLPEGGPPRAMLAYSLVAQLQLLNHYGLLREAVDGSLHEAVDLLDREAGPIRMQASSIATKILGRIPVLYAETRWQALLRRILQQFNENAKILGWSHVFPELNHNEIQGWTEHREYLSLVLFDSILDHPQTQKRIGISNDMLNQVCSRVIRVKGNYDQVWDQGLFWLHLGDWISVELASLRSVDPMDIAAIDFLKAQLAKAV